MNETEPSLSSVTATRRSPQRMSVWVSGIAAALVVALLAGVFLMAHVPGGRSQAGAGPTGIPPTPHGGSASAAPTVDTSGVTSVSLASLGKFSAYRAAYLGQDGRLHVVASDGSNITGPVLPFTGFIHADKVTYSYFDATAAPNGHYLAYVETGDPNIGGPVAILNLTTGAFVSVPAHAQDLAWSPDSARLAASVEASGSPRVTIISASDGRLATVSATRGGQPVNVECVVGWSDTTHLIVIVDAAAAQASTGTAGNDQMLGNPLSGGPDIGLASLDVSTSQVRFVANLPKPPDVYLSPDGTEVFVAPSAWNTTAEIIETATGQTRALPAITQAFGNLPNTSGFNFARGGNFAMATAWQPQSHVLALSLSQHYEASEGASSPGTQASGVWLLDLDADTATRVTQRTYPLAWVPGTQTLLTADPPGPNANGIYYPLDGAGVGPTLYAVTPVQPGAAQTRLAGGMAVYLGLVRTA